MKGRKKNTPLATRKARAPKPNYSPRQLDPQQTALLAVQDAKRKIRDAERSVPQLEAWAQRLESRSKWLAEARASRATAKHLRAESAKAQRFLADLAEEMKPDTAAVRGRPARPTHHREMVRILWRVSDRLNSEPAAFKSLAPSDAADPLRWAKQARVEFERFCIHQRELYEQAIFGSLGDLTEKQLQGVRKANLLPGQLERVLPTFEREGWKLPQQFRQLQEAVRLGRKYSAKKNPLHS